MMECSIALLRTLYPNIQKVVFTDSSVITCMQGLRLDLQSYYIALKGTTWYESKFGAQPNAQFFQEYMHGKLDFQKSLMKKPDYNTFMHNIHPMVVATLQPLYAKSQNMKEFILGVEKEFDCFMFQDWLLRLVTQYIPFLPRIVWEIHLEQFSTKNIHITKLTSRPNDMFRGGGKFADFYKYNL